MQGYKTDPAGWHSGGTTTSSIGTRSTAATAVNCPTSNTIGLESEDEAEYPSFYYNVGTGAKICAADSGSNAEKRGCDGGVW